MSPKYITVEAIVKFKFSVDPADMEGREDEVAPTRLDLMDYLADALVFDVDVEECGDPEGAAFIEAGIEWDDTVKVY